MSIPDSKLQTFGKIGIPSKNAATLIADFCHELVVTVNYRSFLGLVQMMMKTVMVAVNVN